MDEVFEMKILAVDYGDARTGLAYCDEGEMLASPVGVIKETNAKMLVLKITEEAVRLGVKKIVLGNPINMNGTRGPRSELAEKLARMLKEASGLPVDLWDERGTTVSAIDALNKTDVRGKKRKAVVDAVAAVIILENYLSYRKNSGQRD